jgi:microcystin-dependent protein
VQSIWKENINVIQGSGQTPSSSDNTQLKTAIELMIQNAVLTANSQVLAQAKLDAHPVGSLYWSSDPTDPSELFGGTWTQIKDRFIWAKGDSDTVNATGGSKTVQLTESNLPAHTHSCSTVNTNHTHNTDSVIRSNLSEGIRGFEEGSAWYSAGKFTPGITTTSDSNGENSSITHSHIISGGGSGTASGTAHENMPPYIVKYCWERVS